MDILKNLLDENETMLWKRETKQNLIPDQTKFKRNKKREIIIILTVFAILFGIVITVAIMLQSAFFLIMLLGAVGVLQFFRVRINFKNDVRVYESLLNYHEDDVLRNYPSLEVITNKHFIHFQLYDETYPLWYGNDISHVYEFRNEFRFLKLERLTDVCKFIKPKKSRYNLGLYFDLDEYNLFGDDAPHYWLDRLTENEYQNVLRFLAKVAPKAKVSYLFKSQEKLEKTMF